MPTDTQVNDLKINVLSEAQYEQIQSPSTTELYLVPETVDTTPTSGSTNPITSGGVYNALQNIPEQEQSDWNETDATDPAYIKNKPQNIVTDANYVHTDNNYTTTEKSKLADIEAGAEANVQSDWNQTNNAADDFIKNKPNLATVATSGSYNDLSNKPTIPDPLPSITNNSGKVLAVNSTGTGTEWKSTDDLKAFKGWFDSTSALSAAYPSPKVGDYAYIKGATASDPAAIYHCRYWERQRQDCRYKQRADIREWGSC